LDCRLTSGWGVSRWIYGFTKPNNRKFTLDCSAKGYSVPSRTRLQVTRKCSRHRISEKHHYLVVGKQCRCKARKLRKHEVPGACFANLDAVGAHSVGSASSVPAMVQTRNVFGRVAPLCGLWLCCGETGSARRSRQVHSQTAVEEVRLLQRPLPLASTRIGLWRCKRWRGNEPGKEMAGATLLCPRDYPVWAATPSRVGL